MLEQKRGQKRKSARISALEASDKKKREENHKNLHTQQQQESDGEASQENAPPPPPPPPPILQVSGSGQPLPEPKKGGKKKRLNEVAATSAAPTTQQNGDRPKHEDPPISNATLPSAQRMPEKRILEFILDILQRRDTHEIFAQPVDPEEVEGYYNIIEKPMDFGTMRAKLQEEMYTTLKQFEDDVFLISSNAMHFNSSATIYFRQARAIHELAKRVFHTLKTDPQKIEDEFSQTRRRPGRKPRGETGGSRIKLPNNLRRNIRAYRGSSSSNPLVDRRDIEILPGSRDGRSVNFCETESRQTYKPGASLLTENEPMVSTIYNYSKQLVPGDGDIRYKESLMRFVKDLGPTAQMVANRKLRCLEASNYQSQTPSRSVQHPNCLISSPAAQGGLSCMDGVINNQMPRILHNFPGDSIITRDANDRLGIQGAAARGKNVLAGDRMDIHGGAYRGRMALASDRMDMHGAASKGKSVLTGEGMDVLSGSHGGKMALPSGRVNIHDPASKGKNVVIADGMDICGGIYGGKMALGSGRLDIHGAAAKGKNVPAGDSTGIYDGACGGKMMALASGTTDVHRAASKGKNVLTGDNMNIYGGVCREKMAQTNSNSRVDIQGASSKLKNVHTGESMAICGSACGGKMDLARVRADVHAAFQEERVPPVDIMGIRVQGERAHGTNSKAIDSTLHGGMAVNTLGIRDSRGLSKGMIQPSDKRGFLQAAGADVAGRNQHPQNLLGLNSPNTGLEGLSSPSAGITDACGTYMDLLQESVREDIAHQNHNMQNQLGPYLPRAGTAHLSNPIARIIDTSEKYVTKNTVLGSSQLGDRVRPSGSQSQLLEFMSRGNSTVYPSKVIKPSSSGQTSSTLLHALGSHSQGGLGQTSASPNHNYGASSAQVSQAMEWTRPTPWGPHSLYDFPQTQQQVSEVNLLGKNALVQQELQFQFPVDEQDELLQLQAQLTSAPYMDPQQSQLASASFLQPLPTEVNLLGDDAFLQNMQLQGREAFAREAQLTMVPNARNPLREHVYVQQDLQQAALARYMQLQPGGVNPLGEAAFLRQQIQFPVVPPQEHALMGNQHPDLALQL